MLLVGSLPTRVRKGPGQCSPQVWDPDLKTHSLHDRTHGCNPNFLSSRQEGTEPMNGLQGGICIAVITTVLNAGSGQDQRSCCL